MNSSTFKSEEWFDGRFRKWILLKNSLLQDVEKDEYGSINFFKMHDLVNDLAQSISRSASATCGYCYKSWHSPSSISCIEFYWSNTLDKRRECKIYADIIPGQEFINSYFIRFQMLASYESESWFKVMVAIAVAACTVSYRSRHISCGLGEMHILK